MKTLEEIEEYASLNYVPIARKDFVMYLKDLISKRNYHEFLEIGSAIGYTAINVGMMDGVYVTTIEHDKNRYDICQENIKDFKLEDKINSIYGDALELFISIKADVIFIDAAKAKNIAFFEKYKANLSSNGIIIIDNLKLEDFKKRVSKKKADFYDLKLKELREYLSSLDDFKVEYLDIGDGIALLEKNNGI